MAGTGPILTVHRSTQEIGGNCIEIRADDGHRVILDVGRPLDAPKDSTDLLPASLDIAAPVDGVLVSHAHQDHFGLLDEIPAEWPVWCGDATARLITLSSRMFKKRVPKVFHHWENNKPFQLGPFRITPFLTDHSAIDAYMLLIEVGGRRIFYSGDFRTHGRKSILPQLVMATPPADIDVLLMEGTNLGSDKLCVSENELETRFVQLFQETPGRIFVGWSAQNVDRTVTLFRACKRTGRTLVVDLYTAEVMETLKAAGFNRLPVPDWEGVKVVVTSAFRGVYGNTGRDEFVERMAINGISARKLAATPEKWVAMIRGSLLADYTSNGVVPTSQDSWSWSMWRGYLQRGDGEQVDRWFKNSCCREEHIHSSGHAAPSELRAFAKALNPKLLVPIHGAAWDENLEGFPAVRRLKDGQRMAL